MGQLLETKRLTKRFGGVLAIDELDFHIEKGEILGLIGPNGSGKTTFFNVVTGFLKPNGGKIIFVGLVQGDITFYDPEFHRREMTLMSSRNATAEDFAHVINTLKSGADVGPWVTHQATPETIIDEFPTWLDPANGVVKAMLRFD